MITTIIFSKNRACQLDLLLRSLQQNLPNFRQIFILYDATTEKFVAGYELLKKRYPVYGFIQQLDFKQDTLALLDTAACPEDDMAQFVCFMVDDNIIYRPTTLDYQTIDKLFGDLPSLTCFSLRLGMNTIHHDPYGDIVTPFPNNASRLVVQDDTILFWDWATGCRNYGYPFSLDGHIYQANDLLQLLDYDFINPNGLEGTFNARRFRTTMMACHEQSSLVNNPINLVGSSRNAAGRIYGRTLEELNNRYLNGQIINLPNITQKTITACHQEIQIEFETS